MTVTCVADFPIYRERAGRSFLVSFSYTADHEAAFRGVPAVEKIDEHAKAVREPTPGYRPYRTTKTVVHRVFTRINETIQ